MRLPIAVFFLPAILLAATTLNAQGGAAPPPPPALTADDIRQLKALADQARQQAAAADKASATLGDVTDRANAAALAAQQQTLNSENAAVALEAKRKQSADALARLQAVQPAPAVQASNHLLGDHVPCLMDRTDIYASRGLNDPTQLTPAQQQAVIDSIPNSDAKARLQPAVSRSNMPSINFKATMALLAGPLAPDAQTAAKKAEDAIPDGGTFDRPTDVGCSMSIFTWNIAHMVFGRTVANNYLAIQVVVRNMDQSHDFLIHDAELAVDAYSAQLERFQASHEKEAVRAVVLYGQNYDRRAFFTHGMEAIGLILGSIVAVPSSNDILTSATGAYTAGLVPSWQKLFPDLTTSNLNNINDLGFSAAAASRIVVPKGGSVPFVVFIPLKPLEQACWLQKNYVPSQDMAPGTACSAIKMPSEIIKKKGKPLSTDQDTSGISPSDIRAKDLKDLKFKDWNPAQIAALQKHAYAVIAGIHIKDVNASAALRSLICDAQDASGVVHIALLGTKPLTCTLTGADLDTVKTLNAQSTANPTTAPIAAPVTTSGDSTLAKAIFPATATASFVDPAYDLHALDSAGTDTDLKQTLSVLPVPKVVTTGYVPSTIAAAGISTLKIAGTNLAQVTAVHFNDSKGNLIATGTPTTASDASSLTVSISPPLLPLLPPATYSLIFEVDANTKAVIDPKVTYPAP